MTQLIQFPTNEKKKQDEYLASLQKYVRNNPPLTEDELKQYFSRKPANQY